MKRMKKGLKRYICLLLALLFVISPFFSSTAFAVPEERLDVPMVGIDVSSWNQEIDWAKVKEAGVEFAIVRMFHHLANTPNYELDEQFERNVSEAQKYGIELGVYFFSYAKDLASVTTEANMVVNELKKYPGVFSFPIVFDAEDGDTTDDPDVSGEDIYDIGEFAGDACKTFCDILSESGYYPMVYANVDWFENKIGLENVKDYDLWLANWPRVSSSNDTQIYAGTTPSYAASIVHSKRTKLSSYDDNVTMWQYTAAGKCNGIDYGDGGNANVDLNVSYVDYPSIIKKGGYNGYGMNAVVSATDGKTSCYWGDSEIPDSNNNFENPSFMVEGLRGNTNNYKGLENYGTNKDKIMINGRTLSKWESRSGDPIINNIWVYSAGDGKAYVGIDIADTSRLRVKGQSGTGEEIESIVITRGFEIVSTTADLWTGDEITAGATGVGEVVGVFKENVILTADTSTSFNVTLGGSNSLGLDGYTFQTVAPQLVKITDDVNIRSGPNATYASLGVELPDSTFEYLNEIRNSKWLMIDYNGKVGWVSNDYASVINVPQYVNLTADANIRSGPDTSYAILGVGLAGARFEYLNEIQNTKWLKVNYNGQTGWISNVNATLSQTDAADVVLVTAENRDWTETTITEVNLATANSAQIRTQGEQGLRFVSTIDKTSADFDRVVKVGTVLIPSDDIQNISELELGATLNGHDVLDVPAVHIFSETEEEITFTAVLKNIAEENFNRKYTARAYAILDDGSVIYASSGVSRSVYQVAQNGMEDPRVSDADKTVFQEIINKVDGPDE